MVKDSVVELGETFSQVLTNLARALDAAPVPCMLVGVPLFVASSDNQLIYKLIASPQDLVDVDRLIRFGRRPEDAGYVRRWARVWDIEDRLYRARDR